MRPTRQRTGGLANEQCPLRLPSHEEFASRSVLLFRKYVSNDTRPKCAGSTVARDSSKQKRSELFRPMDYCL